MVFLESFGFFLITDIEIYKVKSENKTDLHILKNTYFCIITSNMEQSNIYPGKLFNKCIIF